MLRVLGSPAAEAAESSASLSCLAMDWQEILTWDHDDVLHFTLLAELIDRLVTGSTGVIRVLDVGCGVTCDWTRLFDSRRVRFIQCHVEPVSNGRDFVLVKRDRPLPWANREFDVVLGIDVLRFLPENARTTFVEDCFRVCRAGAIWSTPQGKPELTVQEQYALATAEARYPRATLWGEASPGQVYRDELRLLLQRLDAPHAIFGNAPLRRWQATLTICETMHQQGLPLPIRCRLNEQLGLAYPVGEEPYRLVGVVAREFNATAALEPLSSDSSGFLLEGPGTPL